MIREPRATIEPAASYTDELTLNFAIRDFRYLSHANVTNTTVTDADQMNGDKPITFPINFQTIMDDDASGETYYVVGGRAYFELLVYGSNTLTFTYRGFFDQLDY